LSLLSVQCGLHWRGAGRVVMGKRLSKCVQCMEEEEEEAAPLNSLVPEQDPLQKDRIHRAEIARDFEIKSKVLGTGDSGAVRLAQALSTRESVAVKQLNKKRLKSHLLKSEVEVYLTLDHPNICRLLQVYESKQDVWLVMELCGCELHTRLCERKAYREAEAAELMLQMLRAVSYLHNRNIVHRDVKLDNWLCGATGRDDRLQLIDFGFARHVASPNEIMDEALGTLIYVCPEIFQRSYTSKCDIWSLGVICYMLLVGKAPFHIPNNDAKTKHSIRFKDFPKEGRWTSLSDKAQHLITWLLQKDPSLRPDSAGAFQYVREWKSNMP